MKRKKNRKLHSKLETSQPKINQTVTKPQILSQATGFLKINNVTADILSAYAGKHSPHSRTGKLLSMC
jgi:hypothetical protein